MGCEDSFTILGILITVLIQVVSGEICSNGQYCDMDQYCCSNQCCNRYYNSFWNLWYFWFVMFVIMMSCCGMCSYAKRRQYYGQQHNQIIIPAGQGRVTNITATAYPVGMAAPPHGHHHQPHMMPPQAYQSPPAYSEVTSKPDLYPAYQGPPTGALPYPTQPYPQYQHQPMYPPGPPMDPQFAVPPPISPQPPPYSGPPPTNEYQSGPPPS